LKQKVNANKRGRVDARVSLWKDGTEKTWLVSRLVGLTWCAGYSEGMTINHINGNPLDNRAENLEWVTKPENIRKGFEMGLYDNICKPIILEGENATFAFCSMSAASKFLGRNAGYINNCLKKGGSARDTTGNVYTIKRGCNP
jgi:hypothetical protein